jgi:hypothetical protein
MRASVWIVVLLGAAGASGLASWSLRGADGRAGAMAGPSATPAPALASAARPGPADATATPAARATPRATGARLGDGASSSGGREPSETDTPTPLERVRAGPGAARSTARPAAPPSVDREREREVARLAQDLDLPDLPITRGSRAEALGDASYVIEVADAAMVEYLLRDALWREFHARSQLVPFGYPVDGLRSALAAEVAGLSVGERNALLELVAERLPRQARPIMSRHVEYSGDGFEAAPTGVDFYE